MVEGKTERAFKPHLTAFLEQRLPGRMPRLDMFLYYGRIPKEEDLRRKVEKLLSGRQPAGAVIALTDVYTGTSDFRDAADAKNKMRQWVGTNLAFYAHAAQYEFEAWLLPYWSEIRKIAGHNRTGPRGSSGSREPQSAAITPHPRNFPTWHVSRRLFETARCQPHSPEQGFVRCCRAMSRAEGLSEYNHCAERGPATLVTPAAKTG